MRKVYGIGVSDADYVTQKSSTIIINGKTVRRKTWTCPFYSKWASMLKRCYCKSDIENSLHLSYKDCSVCEEWLTFSNFKAWMEKQDWEGKDLDKDLRIFGNKVYSPDTCLFISEKINSFMIERARGRGKWPIGVTINKWSNKFIAMCNNPFTTKQEYIGTYATPVAANYAWACRKLEHAKNLALLESDRMAAELLILRYTNIVNDINLQGVTVERVLRGQNTPLRENEIALGREG